MEHIVVIGAGAFGGWAALELQRRGYQVSLIDAWGPGHSRASSGGESRLIRCVYGGDPIYIRWSLAAMRQWERFESERDTPLFVKTGMLWLFAQQDLYVRRSRPVLDELGIALEELSPAAAGRRFPHIRLDDLASIYYEPYAGYIWARKSCQEVCRAFVESGGSYLQLEARPGDLSGGRMHNLLLQDGSRLHADHYLFACGPWLGALFPELLGPVLQVSRQELGYFGVPPGTRTFTGIHTPIWVEFGEQLWYGAPDSGRGIKVGVETRDWPMDPSRDDRVPDAGHMASLRNYMAHRYPGLAQAPMVEGRVCQYTNTPDGHFLIDRHPDGENVWLAGGGSGHGFKMGPVIGEHLADLICGETDPYPLFTLAHHLQVHRQTNQFEAGNAPE